jgi:hypothetical protein
MLENPVGVFSTIEKRGMAGPGFGVTVPAQSHSARRVCTTSDDLGNWNRTSSGCFLYYSQVIQLGYLPPF